MMPADSDVVATVGVIVNVVANLVGARDVATVGAIAVGAITAQTNGVGPIDTAAASDGVFQENMAGGKQQVTPLQNALPTLTATTANLPLATGISFAALMDADNTPTLADDDDGILFRAIRVSLPEVAAVLVRQNNKIRALPEQVATRMGGQMMSVITSAITPLAATIQTMNTKQNTILAELKGFKGQLDNLKMDVNDHERRLTHLTAKFKDNQATTSFTTPAELEMLAQSAITPVQTFLDKELALAIKTAEAAMKSLFDTWVHASNDNVAASIKTFEKKIDALHGSSYGPLTKTTLPKFARRIGVLKACTQLTLLIPTEKVDPSDSENVDAKEAAVADDVDDTNN